MNVGSMELFVSFDFGFLFSFFGVFLLMYSIFIMRNVQSNKQKVPLKLKH